MDEKVTDDIVALAKEVGIELTDKDFERSEELSDDEPDAVVGGGRCICSFGGGGENKDGSVRCVCIIGGDGNR